MDTQTINNRQHHKGYDMNLTLKDRTEQLAKYAVLATQGKSSCAGCTTGYCCTTQKIIEISTVEWTERQHLITSEHIDRAKVQVKRFEAESLFTCPFLDPVTKLCDIYDERFAVCAQYHVFNPVEDCNSDTESGLQVINPMVVMKAMASDPKSHALVGDLMHIAQGEPTSIITAFSEHADVLAEG